MGMSFRSSPSAFYVVNGNKNGISSNLCEILGLNCNSPQAIHGSIVAAIGTMAGVLAPSISTARMVV